MVIDTALGGSVVMILAMNLKRMFLMSSYRISYIVYCEAQGKGRAYIGHLRVTVRSLEVIIGSILVYLG